ncbi:3-dehydroquinate synthase [Candidatus Peregrinibacteria bacterium]|nr:3-dehydroquinate synthase [Candidatus Peregrinibacteria bacterium]
MNLNQLLTLSAELFNLKSMATIKVRIPKNDQSYSIKVENGIFKKIPELLNTKKWGHKYAIISDDVIGGIFGKKLVSNLAKYGLKAELFTFKCGDKYKSMESVEKIIEKMVQKGFTRNDCVITLGGGVPGDLGGFVAAIFMRGINYIHVPTSLLAMVDSSIGGKTGVNLQGGKNLAGAIYQPKAVLMDPDLLKTLPKKELLAGLSEVFKYGVVNDEKVFEMFEKNWQKIAKGDKMLLFKLIVQSVKIKTSIIEKDEFEHGMRASFNYGHTAGHALERLWNYKINHGQAIAIGMKLVNNICAEKALIKPEQRDRINILITRLKLIPKEFEAKVNKVNVDDLWKIMLHDKKVVNGIINFVIPSKIGTFARSTNITKQDLKKAIKNYA